MNLKKKKGSGNRKEKIKEKTISLNPLNRGSEIAIENIVKMKRVLKRKSAFLYYYKINTFYQEILFSFFFISFFLIRFLFFA